MPDAAWYYRQVQELEQSRDAVELLQLLLEILAEQPSPGLVARTPPLFQRTLTECLRHPSPQLMRPEQYLRLERLVEVARAYQVLDPQLLEVCLGQIRILHGWELFCTGELEAAHLRFLSASSTQGEGVERPALERPALEELRGLASRAFPVFDTLRTHYLTAGRTGPGWPAAEAWAAEAWAAAAGLLQQKGSVLALPEPGQVGVLFAYRDPGRGLELGCVSRLSVAVENTVGAGIRCAPQLAGRVGKLPPSVRAELHATAEQAAAVAARLLAVPPAGLVWDVDLPDDQIAGPSLGLALCLAILSARSGEPLPAGLVATGAVNLVGGVLPVGSVAAKVRAALWQGGRLVRYPSGNEGHVAAETEAALQALGGMVCPVGSVAAAFKRALPEAAAALPPAGRRRTPASATGPWIARPRGRATLGAFAALLGVSWLWGKVPPGQKREDGAGPLTGSNQPAANQQRPVLRLRYYVADGDYILDHFLRGKYRELFKFERDPLVLDNDVLRLMRLLYRDYFRPKPPQWRRDEIDRYRKLQADSFLDGEWTRGQYRLPPDDGGLFYLEPHPEAKEHPYRWIHRKAIPAQVAKRPFMDQDPLARRLMRENPGVWDLVDLSFQTGKIGCIDPDEEPPTSRERLWLRPLKLLFVDVENVGQSPALDLRYGVRSLAPPGKEIFRLRGAAETDARLASSAEKVHSFPYQSLKPGEHILIPLQVGLGGVNEDDLNTLPEGALADRDEDIYFDLSRPVQASQEPYRRSYFFGPANRITRILFGDTSRSTYEEPARQLAEQRIQVTQVLLSGSCPFLFAYDLRKGEWVNTGSVLVGHHRPEDLGDERRSVSRYHSRFQLRELEPEVSFIDAVSIEGKDARGQTRVVPALDPRLQRVDGVYLRLQQGESFSLEFGPQAPTQGVRTLRLRGFYVPERAAAPLPKRYALPRRGSDRDKSRRTP